MHHFFKNLNLKKKDNHAIEKNLYNLDWMSKRFCTIALPKWRKSTILFLAAAVSPNLLWFCTILPLSMLLNKWINHLDFSCQCNYNKFHAVVVIPLQVVCGLHRFLAGNWHQSQWRHWYLDWPIGTSHNGGIGT